MDLVNITADLFCTLPAFAVIPILWNWIKPVRRDTTCLFSSFLIFFTSVHVSREGLVCCDDLVRETVKGNHGSLPHVHKEWGLTDLTLGCWPAARRLGKKSVRNKGATPKCHHSCKTAEQKGTNYKNMHPEATAQRIQRHILLSPAQNLQCKLFSVKQRGIFNSSELGHSPQECAWYTNKAQLVVLTPGCLCRDNHKSTLIFTHNEEMELIIYQWFGNTITP